MEQSHASLPAPVSYVFLDELHAKTIWIRDELEPVVAMHGPEHLPSDSILELASFFSMLLANSGPSTLAVPHVHPPSLLALNRSEVVLPKLTFHDLQVSRIHLALLLITGKGTRWPMKLVEVCDSLKRIWTVRFGDLNAIRPLLYEKGGILHHVKEEKDMARHAVLVKWMSDRTSLVSPLRALESGHLEYTPGQWWIHPLFAFHDGIIDSPDPQGGITADRDGAYAILLTGLDEIECEAPDTFTYRTRKDDKGKYRLIQTILPHQQSIRVLRSHTLQSLWSPIVGLRYDGLYKVVSYAVSTNKDGGFCLDVRLQREPNQSEMKEVLRHPVAEEFDAYVEYKRLRSVRLGKRRDMSKAQPKSDQILGAISALQESNQERESEKDAGGEFPSRRRGAILPEDQESITEDEITHIISPLRHVHENRRLNEDMPGVLPSLDGTELQSSSSNPPIFDSAWGWRSDRSNLEGQYSPTRNTSVSVGRSCEESGQFTDNLAANDFEEPDALPLSHEELRTLTKNIAALGLNIQRRGTISSLFNEDLKGIKGMMNQLEKTMVENHGSADGCVSDLARQLGRMIQDTNITDLPKDEDMYSARKAAGIARTRSV